MQDCQPANSRQIQLLVLDDEFDITVESVLDKVEVMKSVTVAEDVVLTQVRS